MAFITSTGSTARSGPVRVGGYQVDICYAKTSSSKVSAWTVPRIISFSHAARRRFFVSRVISFNPSARSRTFYVSLQAAQPESTPEEPEISKEPSGELEDAQQSAVLVEMESSPSETVIETLEVTEEPSVDSKDAEEAEDAEEGEDAEESEDAEGGQLEDAQEGQSEDAQEGQQSALLAKVKSVASEARQKLDELLEGFEGDSPLGILASNLKAGDLSEASWVGITAGVTLAVILLPSLFPGGDLVLALLLGPVTFVLGVALTIWGHISLGLSNYTPFSSPVPNNTLVTSGAYKYVRHPIYGGLAITFLGLAVTTLSPVRLLLAIAWLFFVETQVPKEESELVQKHGKEYTDYQADVPKLIPFLPYK
mmetsp:Transcript_7262/g.11518  ORF Transcript_7262/g.11518 Transcript_7262/m.11518 type:complete len:367 (+) Transcript_7262:7-1107(+)|eukprot:CAMPEP_0184671650 /NCGR_PEP_ID=MMETSP0308-20130426/85628_1 /TAXON_ID=38269 /ORGANISM="Gloeochaete witrockiana, Strain SAG 46.84" /LENGTH=366 /DNA_ID=CAMNT_0027118821 /DNA_START=893 /DNA_END=1993 /DNA_ORIENTATION=+